MIWDMETTIPSITNINTIMLQLEKSGEDVLTIKNVSHADLELIKQALEFYFKVHFDLEEIKKTVQASSDLVLELVNDKKGVVEILVGKLEQLKSNGAEKEQRDTGLDRSFRRKI